MLNKTHPFWSFAFRPGFLLASIFSCVSLGLWLALITGALPSFQPALTPLTWHMHEMLFGFVSAIALSFILTAMQNWTKLRSIHGRKLQAMFCFWMTARILFACNFETAIWLALASELIWMAIAISTIVQLLTQSNNKRNFIFIGLFSLVTILDVLMVISDSLGDANFCLQIGRASVLLFGLVVSVVGGRVIPFFTKNRLANIELGKRAELTPIILALSAVVIVLQLVNTTPILLGSLLIAVGSIHLYRLSGWFRPAVLTEPLLWSLHVTYLFLALGFILMGISNFCPSLPYGVSLHVLTIGAFGGMIIAMMPRVSLGHTGRPLSVKADMVIAFILMILSVVLRFSLELNHLVIMAWMTSGLCWIAAYSLFVIRFSAILISPRTDH